MTLDQRLKLFLEENGIKINRFFGRCIQPVTGFLIIGDIISKEEGNLLLKDNGDRLTLAAITDEFPFEEGRFYEFSIFFPYLPGNEIKIFIDLQRKPPILIDSNPYKEIIRLRYERLDNPEANRMIAHLMREIGKGLYSSKQRMIFELLQNADDTPAGAEVSFHIDAHFDYLLFMHNGIPFNRDDVEAITSAAESTKKHDKKKTGYKGIGFKSVFTDSEEVIIKSSSFLFAFKRDHPAYNNFDTFYFNKDRYKEYPKLLTEDKKKYEKQRRTFNGNTDVPWQLIPVWMDELPQVLNSSKLATYNNNVGFAIKFGREKISEYLNAISTFASHPQFMLFLRYVNLFKSFKNGITVRRSGNNPVKIERISSDKNNVTLLYYKKVVDDIPVNDKALASEGVQIFKKEKFNDYGEAIHYFSYDEEGLKPIETIPPKLASFENTSIIFAAPIVSNKLQAEPDYLNGRAASSFFTYLPMKELRIRLPFLINADFVPSSNREELQGDNQWNAYIIAKIAKYHVKWLSEIAELGISMNKVHHEYLSLLLKEQLPDDDSIQLLIDKYNVNYLQTLDEVAFILSDKNKLCKKAEVILDETGICEAIDNDIFYSISATIKYLPHSGINSTYLKFEYLDIEKYNPAQLIDDLEDETNRNSFYEKVKLLEKTQYLKFLNWLNTFCFTNNPDENWLLSLPFIRIKEQVFSLADILDTTVYILKTSKIKAIETIVEKMGFETTDFYIDEFPHIYEKLDHLDNYLTKDLKLYELLSDNGDLSQLSAKEKSSFIEFIKSQDGVGEAKYVHSLALFKSNQENEKLRPLGQLISNKCTGLPKWLQHLIIDEKEENQLSSELKKFLIQKEKILTKVFCNSELFGAITRLLTQGEIDDFYRFIILSYKEKPETDIPNYAAIPWIYSDKSKKFQLPDTFYCHDTLLDLETNNYKNTKSVLETCGDLPLPYPASKPLIKLFSLGCNKESLEKIIIRSYTFNKITINGFLTWILSKNEKEFLKYCHIAKSDDNKYVLSPFRTMIQYYSDDIELISLVSKTPVLNQKLKLLPTEIYSKKYKDIGLLDGNDLLAFLLNNGLGTKEFVKFINVESPRDLKELFIEKLTNIELSSEEKYHKDTYEHKIIDLVMNLGKLKDNEIIYGKFIGKIKINGHPISEKNISDDVTFKIRRNEIEVFYDLKLSDIFNDHNDQTAIVTKVADSFVGYNSDELKKKLFKLRKEDHSKILEKLNSLECDYFSPIQILFILIYKEEKGIKEIVGKKPSFYNYLYDKDKLKYAEKAKEFIDICYHKNYPFYSNKTTLKDFIPQNLIITKKYALPTEKIPSWVEEWLNDNEYENKQKFLVSTGLNGVDSWIHKLRESVLVTNYEEFNKSQINLENNLLLKNTLLWIKTLYGNEIQVLDRSILKPLFDRLAAKDVPLSEILIPVIISSDNKIPVFDLIEHKEGNVYHIIDPLWDTSHLAKIQKHIIESGFFLIDDILPSVYLKVIKPLKYSVCLEFDKPKLQANSYIFNEPFYTEWSQCKNYPILIYKGNALPRRLTYNSITLEEIFLGDIGAIENSIYIIEDDKEDIPYSLKDHIPEEARSQLIQRNHDYIKKNRLDRNAFDYSNDEYEALKRLFGDEIPKGFYKDLNLAALIKGLIFLSKEGYDVSKAEDNIKSSYSYSQLFPVFEPGAKNPVKIKCRSAKSGLLYLRASTWRELLDSDIYLYILTGNDYKDCRLCKTREDVIADDAADYQILRIEATSNPENIDLILTGNFDISNIWLVIRMKNNNIYRSIFEKIGKKEKSDQFEDFNAGYESED
jgi:hypothetical protein